MIRSIVVDDDPMSIKALQHLIGKVDFLELISTFPNAMEASNFIQNNNVDLIFLDVEMPEMTGMELLKNQNNLPAVILYTSKKEYAVESYDHDVIDYLIKPPTLPRFLRAANKAKDFINNNKGTTDQTTKEIYVKVKSLLVKIEVDEILWVEALGDYVKVITAEKKFTVHSTMKSIEEKLPSSQFIRVHRSYIVNFDKITLIEDDIISIDGNLISLGKSYRKEFMKRIHTL